MRLMKLSVMTTTKRNCVFIADLDAECARLCKAQVVRVAWLASAHQARLRHNVAQVGFIAAPFGLGDRENTFVDLPSWRLSRCKGGRTRRDLNRLRFSFD